MQYETKKRSILKAISWRTWATVTTALIVFLFTGHFALALTIGFLEVFAKIGLYFLHERLWHRICYGKKEFPVFVLWFTGLPASGKKEVADRIYRRLKKDGLPVERIDSRDVRRLFPDNVSSPTEVNLHVRRSGHLAAMLEKNGIIVIATVVSPYRQSRDFARQIAKNFIEVHMKSTTENCDQCDGKRLSKKSRKKVLTSVPGTDLVYDHLFNPEITVNVDISSSKESEKQIIDYLKKNVANVQQKGRLNLFEYIKTRCAMPSRSTWKLLTGRK